jgi:hypothetical protein
MMTFVDDHSPVYDVIIITSLDGRQRLSPMNNASNVRRVSPLRLRVELNSRLAIKAGIDSLHPGVKMVLNSGLFTIYRVFIQLTLYLTGEFYSQDLGTGNLELISRFFEKYPDYADRAFLSVKVRLLCCTAYVVLTRVGRNCC